MTELFETKEKVVHTPKVGDTHWQWMEDLQKWIPMNVFKISKSGKSFMAYSKKHRYGSYAFTPNKNFNPERLKHV